MTFPITGQDATLTGLQNIISGYQCGTVYKPIYLEAQAAVALAMYLRAGVTPPTTLVNGTVAGHQREQHAGAVDPADAGVGHAADDCSRPSSRTTSCRPPSCARVRSRRTARSTGSRNDDDAPTTGPDGTVVAEQRRGRCPARDSGRGTARARHDADQTSMPLLQLRGIGKTFGPVQALSRRRPGHPGRAGDGPGRRQRRRQDDPDQVHRRASGSPPAARCCGTASRSSCTRRRTRPISGIATVYQDLALCDNLDIVQNMLLGPREGHGSGCSTRSAWS